MDVSNLYKKVFPVLNAGSHVLPVADGTYFTEANMPEGFENGQLVIAFYDASDAIVTPTAGTITPQMSPIKDQWHASSNTPTIDATMAGATAAYTIPVFPGIAKQGRIILAGITGATYCRAYFWRGQSY